MFVVHTLLDVMMSGSKAGSQVSGLSNANETDNNETVRRKIIFTEKALGCKMGKLQKDHQARVNKMKGVIIASINKYNKGFIEDVTQWLSETKIPVSGHATYDNVEENATFEVVHDDFSQRTASQMLEAKNMDQKLGLQELQAPLLPPLVSKQKLKWLLFSLVKNYSNKSKSWISKRRK